MNLIEYLLTSLAEECAETAQATTKALRFGLNNIKPGQEQSNLDRLADELEDIKVIIGMLEDNGVVLIPRYESAMKVARKREKVTRFMAYAKAIGTLVLGTSEMPRMFQTPPSALDNSLQASETDSVTAHVPAARAWLEKHGQSRCDSIPPRALAMLLDITVRGLPADEFQSGPI